MVYEIHGSKLSQKARNFEGYTFGTAASPAASINTTARKVIQKIIKVVRSIHKAPLGKVKFKDLQVQSRLNI